MPEARRLEGKVALITGASRGIGRGIAVEFARQGARLVLTAAKDRAGLEATAEKVRALGSEATLALGDVASREGARAMVDAALKAYGRLDIVVCNAGIEVVATVVDLAEDDWDRVIAVNLTGTFLICKYAIPHLLSSGGGSIITMGSVAGVVGWVADAAYNASKGGIILLTKTIALDHGTGGIRANCICPGSIETELHRAYIAQAEDPAAEEAALNALHPIGHAGSVEDVAMAAVYLASDESKFVTGSCLMVDGGYTAR
jgi:NAD(P)-dependent dehydrogenase (short-subunit alcohol dehydrogenase family)